MREVDISDVITARKTAKRYAAVVTIEDVDEQHGNRIGESCPQLVVQFSDLSEPWPGFHLASREDIARILEFVRRAPPGPILIHCNAGISRSPACAFAILADELGVGREAEALGMVLKAQPLAIPNIHVVALADAVLERGGAMMAALLRWSETKPWRYQVSGQTSAPLPIAESGGGAIEARVSLLIPTSTSTVFSFVTEPTNDPEWIDAIVAVERVGVGETRVGSRFVQTAVGPLGQARSVWEVTRLEPDRRMECASVAGDYIFSAGYEFATQSGGVLLAKFARFQRTGMLLAVPRTLGSMLMRRKFEQWLKRLATLAEGWK